LEKFRQKFNEFWDNIPETLQAAILPALITSSILFATLPLQAKTAGKESFSSAVSVWRLQKRADAYFDAIKIAENIASSSCSKNECDSHYQAIKKTELLNNLYLYSVEPNRVIDLFNKSVKAGSSQKEKEKHLAQFKLLARTELGGSNEEP